MYDSVLFNILPVSYLRSFLFPPKIDPIKAEVNFYQSAKQRLLKEEVQEGLSLGTHRVNPDKETQDAKAGSGRRKSRAVQFLPSM